jgi:large repetitive protein
VTTAGTYTVTQTVGGCTSAPGSGVAAPIAIPSAPVVTVTDNCGSSTLTATGSNHVWSTGATTASINVTSAGTYTVTQTVGGCTSLAASAGANPIPIPSAPVVTVTNNCGSSTLTATGSNHVWSTGATTSSINVTSAGSYTVTQTVGGCTSAPGTGVAAPLSAPSITVSASNPTTCGGSDGSVTVNGSGTGNVTWTGAGSGSANGVNLPYIITGLTSGSYTVNFNNGCASNSPVANLADPGAPSAPVVTVTDNCGSSTLSATGTNLLWSTGATTASINVTTAGTYTVTQTVGGCTSAPGTGVAAPIAIPSAPVVTVTDNCGSSTLTATGSNHVWSTGATTASINVTSAGTYTVTQTVGGCTSLAASAGANPIPIPSAPVVTVTDNCGSSILTATGSNHVWSTGETTNSIVVTVAGTYFVSQTVGSCVSPTATVSANPLVIPAAPSISASGPTTFCDGGTVDLTSTESTGLLWSTGETTQTITVDQSGVYTLTFTAPNGCVSSQASISVTVNPLPIVTLSSFADICRDSDPFTLTGGSPSLGVYSGPGVTAGVFDPSIAGLGSHSITYTYTDGNGCSGSANSIITVMDCLGQNELDINGIQVYPSPVVNLLKVISKEFVISEIALYDAAGKLVIKEGVNGLTVELSLSDLEPAMYYLTVTLDNGQMMRTKILKQ